MVIVQICVGSSCHLKGSRDIVEMAQKEVAENGLDGQVVLVGGFCFGKCNRIGVTISVNDDVYPGITTESFKDFWQEKVLSRLNDEE